MIYKDITLKGKKIMEHCHQGHRERLLNTISKVGLKNLNEVQILEYILTLVIPRKDTNPLAHRLLDIYGSISKVLDADYKSLIKINGLGENTAKKLATFKDIFKIYNEDKLNANNCLKNYKDLYLYIRNKYTFVETETFYMVGLNKKFKVLAVEECVSEKNDKVKISLEDVLDFITKHKFDMLLLMHNHPAGNPKPSKEDIDNNALIEKVCNSNMRLFCDHIIYGDKQMYSFKNNRTYFEEELI